MYYVILAHPHSDRLPTLLNNPSNYWKASIHVSWYYPIVPVSRHLKSRSQMSDTVYVRDAKPDEYEYAAIVYARAFVTDPIHYWMGSVSKQVILPSGQTIDRDTILTLPKHIKTLFHLHHSLILSTQYVGGRVLVTVRPEENGKEKIVSVTLWIPPLVRVDGPLTVTYAKQYRTIFGTMQSPGGWGLVGLKARICILKCALDWMTKYLFSFERRESPFLMRNAYKNSRRGS